MLETKVRNRALRELIREARRHHRLQRQLTASYRRVMEAYGRAIRRGGETAASNVIQLELYRGRNEQRFLC